MFVLLGCRHTHKEKSVSVFKVLQAVAGMTDNTDTVDSPVDKEMVSHVERLGDREGDDCHLSDRNTGGSYMAFW